MCNTLTYQRNLIIFRIFRNGVTKCTYAYLCNIALFKCAYISLTFHNQYNMQYIDWFFPLI